MRINERIARHVGRGQKDDTCYYRGRWEIDEEKNLDFENCQVASQSENPARIQNTQPEYK